LFYLSPTENQDAILDAEHPDHAWAIAERGKLYRLLYG
jgi:hypothetical protein